MYLFIVLKEFDKFGLAAKFLITLYVAIQTLKFGFKHKLSSRNL